MELEGGEMFLPRDYHGAGIMMGGFSAFVANALMGTPYTGSDGIDTADRM